MPELRAVADWIAFLSLAVSGLALVLSLVALAFAAVRHVLNESERQRRANDARIQELALIVYNQNGQFGITAQLLAIDELATFPKRRDAIARAAKANLLHFQSLVPGSPVIEALEDLIRKVSK